MEENENENYGTKWPSALRNWAKKIVIAIIVITALTLGFLVFRNFLSIKPTNPTPASTPTSISSTLITQPKTTQIKKLQAEIKNLQQASDATKADIGQLAKRVNETSQARAINTSAIIKIQDKLNACVKATADNTELIKKVQKTASANSATLVAHKKTLRNHDLRITTAQLTGNRAIAALMVACDMTPEEATANVNAFVTGDLKIKHLAGIVKKIPRGIKRAQNSANKTQKIATDAIKASVANTKLLGQHGAKKSWLLKRSHDKELVTAAHAAMTLR